MMIPIADRQAEGNVEMFGRLTVPRRLLRRQQSQIERLYDAVLCGLDLRAISICAPC